MRVTFQKYISLVACAALVAALGCQPPTPPGKSKSTTTAASPSAPSTATNPTASEPPTTEPKTTEPATIEPQPSEPDSPAPEATEPMTTEPAPAAPATPEPKPTTPDPPTTSENSSAMTIEKAAFGKTKDGTPVDLYTIQNKHGLVLKMTNYGAIVVDLETPDKDGKLANIQLGFPTLEGYLERHPYFGATIGRYGNRIAGGKFKIGDEEYTLATNNGPNHLHGGEHGFDAVVWNAEEVKTDNAAGVKFTYTSADGEEGYPGELKATVTYLLTNDDELSIEYEATTDRPTVVNLTNHCYWNLGGAGSGQILDHELMIAADKYLPIDETSIPTGELAPVAGTPFDFTKPTAIGARIDEVKQPPHVTKGYDHCYVLRGQEGKLELAARVKDPDSGRVMEVFTTEPGIQLYCGNFLDGSASGGGFKQHEAFCLETQHYPDSPNHPDFPSTLLKPGEKYQSKTVHKFSVEK
jgi:aldose 1-epimerase